MQAIKRLELNNIMQPVIADALLRWRKTNQMSQERMAMKLKISVRTYADLEHMRTLPSATTLAYFLTMLSEQELKMFLQNLHETLGTYEQQSISARSQG